MNNAAVSSIVLVFFSGIVSTAALGQNNITDCNDFCDIDCSGQGDHCKTAVQGECEVTASVLTCGAGEGPILLKSGTDLDLNGQTIECESGVNCGDAIKMEDTNSRIYNSDSVPATITGRFGDGVDCGGFNGSKVEGITIHNSYVGIRNCKIIEENVITGIGRIDLFTANYGVVSSGVTTSGDTVQRNYFEGKLVPIRYTGDGKPKIRDNVIHTDHYGLWVFDVSDSDSEPTIESNIVLGTGSALSGTRLIVRLPSPPPSGATSISGNICNEDHNDCQNCQDDGHCVAYESPFLY